MQFIAYESPPHDRLILEAKQAVTVLTVKRCGIGIPDNNISCMLRYNYGIKVANNLDSSFSLQS